MWQYIMWHHSYSWGQRWGGRRWWLHYYERGRSVTNQAIVAAPPLCCCHQEGGWPLWPGRSRSWHHSPSSKGHSEYQNWVFSIRELERETSHRRDSVKMWIKLGLWIVGQHWVGFICCIVQCLLIRAVLHCHDINPVVYHLVRGIGGRGPAPLHYFFL